MNNSWVESTWVGCALALILAVAVGLCVTVEPLPPPPPNGSISDEAAHGGAGVPGAPGG